MRVIVFLLVMVGLLAACLWAGAQSQVGIEAGFNTYHRILDGNAGVPYQQRVLLPVLMMSWQPAIETFAAGVIGFHFIIFPLWFVGLWLWLKRFGDQALAVTILSGLFIVLGFQGWGAVSTWTAVEIVAMVWLLVLIDRDITCLGIIVLATLNRPFTAGVLVLVYVLYHGKQARSMTVLLVWLVTYVGLLILLPANRWTMGDPIGRNLERNTGTFLNQGILNNVMWLMVWVIAIRGWRRATRKLRVLSLAIVPYLLACAVSATWYEVRLLLTVYPLAGALMVVGLEDDR